MSRDYETTWDLRQQYYSPEATTLRELKAMEDANVQGDQAAMKRRRDLEIEAKRIRLQSVIDAQSHPSVPTSVLERIGNFVGEVGPTMGERAADVVPSIGLGLIEAADNTLDFGAHVIGLEDSYNQLSDWFERTVPLYEPKTGLGPVVAGFSQLAIPYGGAVKLMRLAGATKFISGLIAAGATEGLVLGSADTNFAEAILQMVDTAPEAPELTRDALIDAFVKTDEELRILYEADERAQAGRSIEGQDLKDQVLGSDFDPEAYREVYFRARLKNALSGVGAEVLGEALFATGIAMFRTMSALKDPTSRQAMVRVARSAVSELATGPGPIRGQQGQIEPFLRYRRENQGNLDALATEHAQAARAVVSSPVEAAEQLLEEATTARTRMLTHKELAELLPPATRRARGLGEPGRHTTVTGGRYADLDLEAPALPNANISDDTIHALWSEAIDFMEKHGYPAQQVINDIRVAGHGTKEVRPRAGDFWELSLALPNRARYWYEVSAEGMRDMLPDLSDEEFKTFIDLVAMTSQSTAPTQNMMRAIGVLSHTLRDLPSEQDIIDPTTVLRTFGQANEGLKVGSFGGTFLHHLGLRDIPQLSTNDRQVASTFGMGPIDIAQNPVMYGVLSRFYQNLRDHLNKGLRETQEPWETWQLQSMGWVRERIEGGNTDFDDYLDVLQKLSTKAREAGLPVGPNGELTREVLSDPRLDPIMATTITEYRQRLKVGLPITGRQPGYQQSIGMRNEFEALGDDVAVKGWYDMERRALKRLLHTRRVPKVTPEGEPVFTEKRTRAMVAAPSPAQELASALAGRKVTITRTSVGSFESGAVGRAPLPVNATDAQVRAWLSVMGSELGQPTMRAGRFQYLENIPNDLDGKATSVLYQSPEPLTPAQVQAFQRSLTGHWQVDAHIAPNGTVLDVHPIEGRAADPAALEKALQDAGLDPSAAHVVWSQYRGISVGKNEYGRSMTAWRNEVLRDMAEPFASALGGMREARAVISGRLDVPADVPVGKAFRERIDKARARFQERMRALESARRSVRTVRAQLDKDARAYVKKNQGRLERRRRAAEKERG